MNDKWRDLLGVKRLQRRQLIKNKKWEHEYKVTVWWLFVTHWKVTEIVVNLAHPHKILRNSWLSWLLTWRTPYHLSCDHTPDPQKRSEGRCSDIHNCRWLSLSYTNIIDCSTFFNTVFLFSHPDWTALNSNNSKCISVECTIDLVGGHLELPTLQMHSPFDPKNDYF